MTFGTHLVFYNPIGPIFKGQRIGLLTLEDTTTFCVTTQKTADLIYFAVEV